MHLYHLNKRCNCICGAHNFNKKKKYKRKLQIYTLKDQNSRQFRRKHSFGVLFVCSMFAMCSLDAHSFVCCCRFTFPSSFAATLIFPLLSTCKHTTESCNAHLCQPLRRCLFVILLSHALLFLQNLFFLLRFLQPLYMCDRLVIQWRFVKAVKLSKVQFVLLRYRTKCSWYVLPAPVCWMNTKVYNLIK